VDLSKPSEIGLEQMHREIDTNFTAVVDLTVKLLPHLMARGQKTGIVYTGSNLSWVPASGLPMYSASKAALSAFILCLRDQLSRASASVTIIELSPPLVQSELHDYMGAEKGRALGMPLRQFTEAAYAGLAEGKDEIVIGAVGPPPFNEDMHRTFHEIVEKRRTLFSYLAKLLRGEKRVVE